MVDSFNIHRLVIAGVTCASKFFSDVFYTNSREVIAQRQGGGMPSDMAYPGNGDSQMTDREVASP